MKRVYFITALLLVTCIRFCFAQHTFSICAVDPATGEVGSAGATCITSSTVSADIISSVHAGVGVIHTQASWVQANQDYGDTLMNRGLLPQQIIDSLLLHDAEGNPTIRQYGVVELVNGGTVAAFTGDSCLNYHNHITGPTYSIQGNILLGPQILDSMQSRFLHTSGSLACRLMAALEGGKMIGSDSRCTPYHISSFSAFIRVAGPTDPPGAPYLNITVNTYPKHKDPIDSLQKAFIKWGGCDRLSGVPLHMVKTSVKAYPNPADNNVTVEGDGIDFYEILNLQGVVMSSEYFEPQSVFNINLSKLNPGMYFLRLRVKGGYADVIRVVKI